MRILLQRVTGATLTIEGEQRAKIGPGVVLLVGFRASDNASLLQPMIDKILNLRIFPKEGSSSGFELPLSEIKGSILAVSQFTLYADTSRGRRPSFSDAMEPHTASQLFDEFYRKLSETYSDGLVASGVFQAYMQVALENDGPVTLLLEREIERFD